MLMKLVLPLGRFVDYFHLTKDADGSSMHALVQRCRARLNSMEEMGLKAAGFHRWAKAWGCPVATFVWNVDASSDILEDYGFPNEDHHGSGGTDFYGTQQSIAHVYLPERLIPDEHSSVCDPDSFGLQALQANPNIAWDRIDNRIPIVLHFHGGGLTLGSPDRILDAVERVHDGLIQKKQNNNDPDLNLKMVVLISAGYSLAPEKSFPAAPLDALNILAFVIGKFPNNPVHILGTSAGGYCASVAAMEGIRRFPGRIASALLVSPMLDPKADSLSYFANANSAYACPAGFVRYGWQAFFDLEKKESDVEDNNTTEIDDPLACGSNRTIWENSKWNVSSLKRLALPFSSVPQGLDSSTAPVFIVGTNRGDVLYNDGLMAVEALRQAGASKVEHVDAGGCHVIGYSNDCKANEALLDAWRRAVFQRS